MEVRIYVRFSYHSQLIKNAINGVKDKGQTYRNSSTTVRS